VTPQALPNGRRGGWLARRDPRLRIVSALAFALVCVSLTRPAVALAALVLAFLLALTGGLGVPRLARRLLALEGFLLVLLVTLPFSIPGEPLLTIGSPVATREGLEAALLILCKANAVVLALLGLVGGLEPVVFGHALGRLGVPLKLVHLLLFTVRQIHVLHREYLRLRQAMRARAFVPRSDRHSWNSYGHLLGMLLVRSVERARRVLAAMRCRGFDGRLYLLDITHWRPADTGAALMLLVMLALLPVLDRQW
jgi:cobalt/nickel transport system permease protein